MPDTEANQPRRVLVDVSVCVALAVTIGAAYATVVRSGFIEYDDNDYVVSNAHVLAGLTRDGVTWAFKTLWSSNWHPLTWLSLMADTSLYHSVAAEGGPDAFGYHLTNLLLHITNSMALYLALRAMTGTRWRAALVAALFALHPLHVESVAWIAERKDVLSALFWMLTLLAYSWYTRRPSILRYGAVFFALSLGLLAKPMLVTLPCVLLLLDYWPLNRFAAVHGAVRVRLVKLILEKLPLFAVAAVSCIVTVYAQNGAMPSFRQLPMTYRLANAAIAYALYIGKMIYPVRLAIHYPHNTTHTSLALGAAAGVALAGVTCLAVLHAKRRPYFIVGWLWFLGTLAPVIGLVQVGSQALADRYTYLPLVGLFIVIAWSMAELADGGQRLRAIVSGFAVAALLILALLTRWQVSFWRTNDILFTRVLEVTGDNVVAHEALGLSALARGDMALANHHFGEALRIRPNLAEVLDNYGVTLIALEKYDDAVGAFRRALELDPAFANAQNHWGKALVQMGRAEEAVAHFREALELDPEYADALNNLGAALLSKGKSLEATAYLSKAVALAPRNAAYQLDLALALDIRDDTGGAIEHAKEAARLDPHFTKALDFLRTLRVEP